MGNWFNFSKVDEQEATLNIYEDIGMFGITAIDFINELKQFKGRHLDVRINSPGGSVTDGVAIYNALKRHNGGVTVHIDSLAASMASVIAMAGNPVYIADNAMFMIHDPYAGVIGTSEELRKSAKVLDVMKKNLIAAYTKKTGMDEKEISKMMSNETWLDSVEAVALGFADAIEEGVAAAACMTPEIAKARFDKFQNNIMEKETENQEVVEEIKPSEIVEEQPEAETVEVITETPVVAEEAAPVAEASNSLLVAKMQAIVAENAVLKTEVLAMRNDIKMLSALAGVAPANVVPPIGAKSEATDSLMDQFNAIKDPAERTRFFRKHESALKQLSQSK